MKSSTRVPPTARRRSSATRPAGRLEVSGAHLAARARRRGWPRVGGPGRSDDDRPTRRLRAGAAPRRRTRRSSCPRPRAPRWAPAASVRSRSRAASISAERPWKSGASASEKASSPRKGERPSTSSRPASSRSMRATTSVAEGRSVGSMRRHSPTSDEHEADAHPRADRHGLGRVGQLHQVLRPRRDGRLRWPRAAAPPAPTRPSRRAGDRRPPLGGHVRRGARGRGRLGADQPRQPEVHHAHPAVAGQQHVLGLQVGVDHLVAVRFGEGVGDGATRCAAPRAPSREPRSSRSRRVSPSRYSRASQGRPPYTPAA